MLDPALDDLTRERANSTGVDWRNAWAGHREDGTLVAWPPTAAGAIGAEPLEVALALVTNSPLEPVRRGPLHAGEMISEVRSAERLRGLLHRQDWWLIAGEDDYVGWVHDWVLEEAPPDPGPVAFRYGRPVGTLWVSDHHAAVPLLLGTPLWRVDGPLAERGGNHLLRTASGEEGWVAAGELLGPVAPTGMQAALNRLRALMGTPYRWGGRSPLGFDCSGLVQFVAQLSGADLPRDASQQAKCGEGVALDPASREAGDLVFFGDPADHVGFADGRGGLLHCRGKVRYDRFDDVPELVDRISAVRRWASLRAEGTPRAWTASAQ